MRVREMRGGRKPEHIKATSDIFYSVHIYAQQQRTISSVLDCMTIKEDHPRVAQVNQVL